MRILVVGGNGMAGHIMLQYLAARTSYEVFYTLRDIQQFRESNKEQPDSSDPSPEVGFYKRRVSALFLEAEDILSVEKLVDAVRPHVIVNCAGILNDYARQNVISAYRVNGLLPHQLASVAEKYEGRLIHISTDCVFSGNRGQYTEGHMPDGTSVYAMTKALGEVTEPPHLTIRTSIIGPEVRKNGIGLLDWFMHQRGDVKGYVNVLWNGVTTLELAKFTRHAIEKGMKLTGLVHLTAAETVSKYALLQLFACIFNKRNVSIHPDDVIKLDRTLLCTRTDLDYEAPCYAHMLTELREWMRAHHG